MSTSALPGRLLRGLVDDAAVFPPGNSPLPLAVADHRRHLDAPYGAFVGPLLVRAADAPAAALLFGQHERLGVALVVRPGSDPTVLPTAVDQLQREGRAVVRGLELPVSDPLTLHPVTELGVPVWLEVSGRHLDEDLDAVVAAVVVGVEASLMRRSVAEPAAGFTRLASNGAGTGARRPTGSASPRAARPAVAP